VESKLTNQNENTRLLIVDDEKSICDILSQYLQRLKYRVTTANSGEKAIQVLEGGDVDLVLTDIKMPGISGVDLLKWIRERSPGVPVLMTTGYPTLDTAIEALKLGAFDYLTKPFHLEEIGEKIKRALTGKRLEEENLVFSKLVSLHEVTKVLATTYKISELNQKFLDFSTKIARADGGALMFSEGSARLRIVDASAAPFDAAFWERQEFLESAQWVIDNGEPLILEAGSEQKQRWVPPLPEGLQSYIAFPLRTPTRAIGVLNLVRVQGRDSFSNVDLEIINVLASQASIAIENVRLYENIRDNYLKTIRAFALAVEAKDRWTHGHSENVMKYTVVLARELGLPEYEIELVKYAGLLHDIGKIGVSELILNKPGRLTKEEFDEIKKHPELGTRIIADVPFLKSLVPMVRHHHEYFDGRGYPEGKSHDDIPFGARILSVADSYEAMTANRPYRKALPSEEAVRILVEQKEKQFDPKIVDVFLDILHSDHQPK
jgi:putative nucleotidyltransferase with HDIG domain